MANPLVSPKGIAVFPHLVGEPDEYQGKKFWGVNLRLSPEAIAPVQALVTEALKAFRAQIAADPTVKPADKAKIAAYADAFPWKLSTDKEGNPDGSFLLSFKTNYEFKDKLGNLKTSTVPIFDAKGTPFKPATLWGGSELKVSYFPHPYHSGSSKTVGVSLRLQGVQVFKLIGGNGRDASGMGFQAEEGYQAQAADAAPEFPADAATGEAKSGGDY